MDTTLPAPRRGEDPASDAQAWVREHLADLAGDAAPASPRFRGGQTAADAALAAFRPTGYAARRSGVWPPSRRGASGLSPYIRHGLLPLPRVWAHVAGGPARDVARFRDELLWQEYARHVYARLGRATGRPFRFSPPKAAAWQGAPWPEAMACMERVREELESDGWLVNQTRMWLASQWSVRAGADWREGEDHFFRNLLDGSRAANRLGWQWTVGTATGKPYGFSRWQVERRAPEFCARCQLADRCPIEAWPETAPSEPASNPAALGPTTPPETGAGPETVEGHGLPEAVWLTAESLGDADPALAAHPELPVVFVFDAPRLARWQLSAKRLIFLAESLADLATRRRLELWRGSPEQILAGRRLAATYTPVPGWRALARRLDVVACHPWPWLRRPHAGPMRSFSQWRKGLQASRVRAGR